MKLGNAYLNDFVILKGLPAGDYAWGVQAIDASYEGSAFATGTFSVSGTGISQAEKVRVADIYSYDKNLVVRIRDAADAVVSVYNVVGQRMISRNISGEFQMSLPHGIYVVNVETDTNIQTSKVFIK